MAIKKLILLNFLLFAGEMVGMDRDRPLPFQLPLTHLEDRVERAVERMERSERLGAELAAQNTAYLQESKNAQRQGFCSGIGSSITRFLGFIAVAGGMTMIRDKSPDSSPSRAFAGGILAGTGIACTWLGLQWPYRKKYVNSLSHRRDLNAENKEKLEKEFDEAAFKADFGITGQLVFVPLFGSFFAKKRSFKDNFKKATIWGSLGSVTYLGYKLFTRPKKSNQH